MRVPVRVLLAALAVSLVSFAAAQQSAPPSGPPPGGSGMRPQFPAPTNLQVLPKDIPTDDLLKIMHGYTVDLGVNCLFCHARGEGRMPNFASDANPHKAIARTMISMVGEINHKYLASLPMDHGMPNVSCATCHQGHSTPPAFVPPPQEHRQAPPAGGGAAPPPPPA